MTRLSATERQLFDLFNVRAGETADQRIHAAQSRLVSRGTGLADARIIASAAHDRWLAETKPMDPN